jgi:hypothetical protein
VRVGRGSHAVVEGQYVTDGTSRPRLVPSRGQGPPLFASGFALACGHACARACYAELPPARLSSRRPTLRTCEQMRLPLRLLASHGTGRATLARPPQSPTRRLVTLAIETSCDDTSVAVLETKTLQDPTATAAKLHFHEKITSNNAAFNGVHPLAALESHQENLADLVTKAIEALPGEKRQPDFISVTRGPGMRSNLFTGLDTAKGLAAAWKASEAA